MININSKLTLENIIDHSLGARIVFKDEAAFRAEIKLNHSFFKSYVAAKNEVYGVTSGFGGSSHRLLDPLATNELQRNLTRYHRCGVGGYMSRDVGRATIATRLRSLCNARSGVDFALLEILKKLSDADISPAIPAQGSVGASGDLTPLAYLAALVQGEHVAYGPSGQLRPAAELMKEAGISPLVLKDREGLAMMNGTSFMCAIAALAWTRARKIADEACRISGTLADILGARTSPFTELLNSQKPHAGQIRAAATIRQYVDKNNRHMSVTATQAGKRGIQDPYSIRCAPQVIGVLYDALEFARSAIETEMNGVSDNPIFIHEEEVVLNGGQFFGGHIALVCDTLKSAVAATLNLVDRQLALILDGRYRDLIPENLVDELALGERANYNHGFKALQITVSALAAEAAKCSMPMAVFSRPTESANQDVVSMGTIAARDLENITNLAADGVSISLLAMRQAAKIRISGPCLSALSHLKDVDALVEPLMEDRPMDDAIQIIKENVFGLRSPEASLRL
jgi:histidine ammonia-lyase